MNQAQTQAHPDTAKPIKTLRCCCCGGYSEGRQFHNQDTGYGLGACCVDEDRRHALSHALHSL